MNDEVVAMHNSNGRCSQHMTLSKSRLALTCGKKVSMKKNGFLLRNCMANLKIFNGESRAAKNGLQHTYKQRGSGLTGTTRPRKLGQKEE